MEKFEGRLEFIDLRTPIRVFGEDDKFVDIQPLIDELFTELHDTRISKKEDMNSFECFHDIESEYKMKYDGQYKAAWMESATGSSNIGYYLEMKLQRLNGRKIVANFDKQKRVMKVEPMDDGQVYGLYYTRNNACAIPTDDVKKICQPGTHNCCIFLMAGSEGFECSKFDSSTAGGILARHHANKMNANRIGNCAILGRREPPKKELDLTKYSNLTEIAENQEKYIGWIMEDSGDSMDRRMGAKPMATKVKGIEFELNENKTGASFSVIGEEFTCSFNVEYGYLSHKDDEELIFRGYGGHEWRIYNHNQ